MDDFDPDRLRCPPPDARPTPPRHRRGGRFLNWQVPWDWLDAAGRLPGKALHVGLVLWHRAGLARSRQVRLCLTSCRELGLGEQTARRGLRALRAAGLVAVEARPGRGLSVTLLEAPAAGPDSTTSTPKKGGRV